MVVLKSPTNRRPRMASIPASVQRIKDNLLGLLNQEPVERGCRECGHCWRDRQLDPATTVALFMQQVLHGNIPCSEVRHVGATLDPPRPVGSFSIQAYCEARARLPLAVYQALLAEVGEQIAPLTGRQEHRWHGHRTFHIDGSTFSMPDTPELCEAFGMPSGQTEGCGFPVAHLLVLFSAATGILIDAWASPLRTGDLAEAPEAHLYLDEGDVLIGDDVYGGYPHLALLQNQVCTAFSPCITCGSWTSRRAGRTAEKGRRRWRECPVRAGSSPWARRISWSSTSSPRTSRSG